MTGSTYYKAILQNLFFATLNLDPNEARRAFINDNRNYQVIGVEGYRYKRFFRPGMADQFINTCAAIPFLNGGLFECLDKNREDRASVRRLDCFSNRKENEPLLAVPDTLFFDPQRGLFPLLNRYNFTVEENTPLDQEVALDPELLGKVFENLLASYNPETGATARKQTGSFYTPREIVDYMAEAAIAAALGERLPNKDKKTGENGDKGASVHSEASLASASAREKLFSLKILDPACGSGAFPMGILTRLLEILGPKPAERYATKLRLIENCIYGVDIQPIAVQIAKLRFFISLVCDWPDGQTPPLPNLENNFVCANTLVGKKKQAVATLFDNAEIENVKKELSQVRHDHFSARHTSQKKKLRKRDAELRARLFVLLSENDLFAPEDARQLAAWDPYDQNATSAFFDPEWMFDVKDGFDIVIGNPPYVQLQNNGGALANQYKDLGFETFERTGDIYTLFYERGYQFLRKGGHLCYITSNKWMRAGYGASLRQFFSQKTHAKTLIDFAGQKIFDSATVDTNILLLEKTTQEQDTLPTSAVIATDDCRENLSLFVRHNAEKCCFKGDSSWVILSPIERSIKEKIERIGTPLKDWDVKIYRGILTGCNEAFIIDEAKRQQLIAEDPKSAEIIRPDFLNHIHIPVDAMLFKEITLLVRNKNHSAINKVFANFYNLTNEEQVSLETN